MFRVAAAVIEGLIRYAEPKAIDDKVNQLTVEEKKFYDKLVNSLFEVCKSHRLSGNLNPSLSSDSDRQPGKYTIVFRQFEDWEELQKNIGYTVYKINDGRVKEWSERWMTIINNIHASCNNIRLDFQISQDPQNQKTTQNYALSNAKNKESLLDKDLALVKKQIEKDLTNPDLIKYEFVKEILTHLSTYWEGFTLSIHASLKDSASGQSFKVDERRLLVTIHHVKNDVSASALGNYSKLPVYKALFLVGEENQQTRSLSYTNSELKIHHISLKILGVCFGQSPLPQKHGPYTPVSHDLLQGRLVSSQSKEEDLNGLTWSETHLGPRLEELIKLIIKGANEKLAALEASK